MRHYDDSSLGYQKLNRATNKYLSCDSNGEKKMLYIYVYLCVALRLLHKSRLSRETGNLKKKYYLIEYHRFTGHSSRFYSFFYGYKCLFYREIGFFLLIE